MGILVTWAKMGQGSDDIALDNGATVADLVKALEAQGIEIRKGTVVSMGTVEIPASTPLRNHDQVFFSEPVYEGN